MMIENINSFLTVDKRYRTEFIEKKSRFISYIDCVTCESEVSAFLAELRKLYSDASHHVWAYRLLDGKRELYSDDGEPSGSSGKPTIMPIIGNSLFNVMIVTIRYYGGTKLGVGGLVRAYGRGALDVIKAAKIVEVVRANIVEFEIDYNELKLAERYVSSINGEILDKNFSQIVKLKVRLPQTLTDGLSEYITGLTRGKTNINIQGTDYIIWHKK